MVLNIMENFSYSLSAYELQSKSQKLAVVSDNSLTAVKVNQAVRIRMKDGECIDQATLETIHDLLHSSVQKFSDLIALASQESQNGKWNYLTYRDLYEECWKVAKSFLKLGLERYKAVCLLGFNTPRWFYAYIGSILAGGVGCGIYSTNKAEACRYALEKSSANIAVVENKDQINKILQVWDKLPDLKFVIQYSGEVEHEDDRVYSWSQLLDFSHSVPDDDLREVIKLQKVNECCQIVFTSGTTGQPKAALISHDNVTNTARQMVDWIQLKHEKILSYLPLSHIAAQMTDIWISIASGSTVYFAQPDVLKGTLNATLKSVKPTVFLGIPRIWEKIASKLEASHPQKGCFYGKVVGICQNIGWKALAMKSAGSRSTPFGFSIANSMLFKKVLSELGLDSCRLFVSCAAPLSEEVQRCMWQHHVPVIEMYGLSESSGPHTACLNMPKLFKYQSVGQTMPNHKIKLAGDFTQEVCLWGRNIMMGYLDLPDVTARVIDEEGWFRTGDLGHLDSDGFLSIVGRIKDLIITAGGENIPFLIIEELIKDEMPMIGHCVLVGDGHRFLSVLLTIECEVDDEGMASDRISSKAIKHLQESGCSASNLHQLLSGRNHQFIDVMKAGFDRVNSKVISRAHTVRKWSLLPDEFTIEGGEIGPTMKIRRNFILNKYKNLITAIYSESPDTRYNVYDVA